MVRKTHFIKIALLLFLLPTTARADEPLIPISFTGHYDFAFSGIPFGRLEVVLNQNATHYDASSDIEITGIAKMLITHESHTTSTGKGKDFIYPDSTYESRYSTRKKPKYVQMTRKNGVFVSEKAEPADNRAVRAAVTPKDKNGASDPLFLALAIRAELARCLKAGCKNFTLNYYDGRRLTKLDFAMIQEKNIRISGEKYPVYELNARRTPIAGYTQKELTRIGSNGPTLNIYFSHDTRLVPLLLEVPLTYGTVSATLRQ